jgi:hypothetical protein
MKKNKIHLLAAAMSVITLAGGQNVCAKSATESLQQGSVVKVNFRTRYESVTEETLTDSDALTTRSRLSYQSGVWNGIGFTAEFDDVTNLTNDVDYRTAPSGDSSNAGTAIIADPEGTEVNQAFLSYSTQKNQLKYGRQRLILDNARFVGNVGWRQNEQTYDGVSFVNTAIPHTNFTYAYIANVNRIFGEANPIQGDHKHNSHLINASYAGFGAGKLMAYVYLLDNKSAAALSSDTYGVRWQSASAGIFSYNLEYAKQQDAGAMGNYAADYLLAEALFNTSGVNFTLGYELLGSDNGHYGFATPLATLHGFQGWADKFLSTPANGIEDKYVTVGTTFVGAQALLSFHTFNSDENNQDLGNEIDISASKKWGAVMYTAKYADYSAGDVAALKDTTKFWLMADWSF